MKVIKIHGDSSELILNLSHPIILDEDERYKLGLAGLYSFNNVYNVCRKCKLFFHFYDHDRKSIKHTVEISEGYWALKDMEKYVKEPHHLKTKATERSNLFAFEIYHVFSNKCVNFTSPLLLELGKKLRDLLGIQVQNHLYQPQVKIYRE